MLICSRPLAVVARGLHNRTYRTRLLLPLLATANHPAIRSAELGLGTYTNKINDAKKKINSCSSLRRSFSSSITRNQQHKLMEVGELKVAQPAGTEYKTGQMFLHKLFGYRGIILFSYTANVFEKKKTSNNINKDEKKIDQEEEDDDANDDDDDDDDDDEENSELERTGGPPEREKAKQINYYQVLIDNRDIPYIRAHPESVTFLSGPRANRSVYSIHGLDYVSHDDVVPYKSTENTLIVHDLFDKLFTYNNNNSSSSSSEIESSINNSESQIQSGSLLTPKDSLRAWMDKNHSWLGVSDIFVQTTQNIRVTAIPFYIGVKEEQKKKLFWWRYSIRIENLNPDEPVMLRERHWRIFSQAGTFETVRGKGVVGQEPKLATSYPVFQYSSHVNLQARSGHMWGTFKMEKADGSHFEVRIPSFYLDCKEEDANNNDSNNNGGSSLD